VTLSIEKLVDKKLHASVIFRAPTIDQLSSLLEGNQPDNDSYLVPMQPNGDKNRSSSYRGMEATYSPLLT